MPRFTLFAKRTAPAPAQLAAIEDDPGIQVVDRTGDRAFLIETDEANALRLRALLEDWIVEPERTYSMPDLPYRPENKKGE